MELAYRLATATDLSSFFDESPWMTMRAVTITGDGEPLALIGVARWQDHARYFSEVKPELEPHLHHMTVLRAIKKSIKLVSESALPVLAIAEDERSPILLTRLGFEPIDENNEVFRWPS